MVRSNGQVGGEKLPIMNSNVTVSLGLVGKKGKNSIKRISPASEMLQAHRSRSRSIDFINTTALKIDRTNFIFRLDYSYHYRYHAAAAVYFCGITFKMEIMIPLGPTFVINSPSLPRNVVLDITLKKKIKL